MSVLAQGDKVGQEMFALCTQGRTCYHNKSG